MLWAGQRRRRGGDREGGPWEPSDDSLEDVVLVTKQAGLCQTHTFTGFPPFFPCPSTPLILELLENILFLLNLLLTGQTDPSPVD